MRPGVPAMPFPKNTYELMEGFHDLSRIFFGEFSRSPLLPEGKSLADEAVFPVHRVPLSPLWLRSLTDSPAEFIFILIFVPQSQESPYSSQLAFIHRMDVALAALNGYGAFPLLGNPDENMDFPEPMPQTRTVPPDKFFLGDVSPVLRAFCFHLIPTRRTSTPSDS